MPAKRFRMAPTSRRACHARVSFLCIGLFAALLGVARAGASAEDVNGLYRLDVPNDQCAKELLIDNRVNLTARITTDIGNCDYGSIDMIEGPPSDRGDKITQHLVRIDKPVVGGVVLGTVGKGVKCDPGLDKLTIPKGLFLNMLRPRRTFKYLTTYYQGEYYVVLRKKPELTCFFKRVRGARTTAAPNNPTGGKPPRINMWAWLGPLVGLAVLLVMAMATLLVMKKRESRWYPFPSGSPDMDEAAFFGRISNTSPHRPGSLDVPRGPSGVVFEPGSTVAVPARTASIERPDPRAEEPRSPVQLQAMPNLSWDSSDSDETETP